jgi:hypothetical protein
LVGPDGVARPAGVGPGGAPPGPGAAGAKKGGSWLAALVALVLLAVVVLLVVRYFWTEQTTVTVAGHAWRREIAIERYDTVKDKGACASTPPGARVIERHRADPVCTTRKVDQGDGTFKEKKECTEPVEQCTYEVEKWSTARTVSESGDKSDTPRWPVPRLPQTGNCRGCEREGERKETYTVRFKETKSGEAKTCDFTSESKWSGLAVGSKWTVAKRVLGGSLDCDSLKPAK